MKHPRFTANEISSILKAAKAGEPVTEGSGRKKAVTAHQRRALFAYPNLHPRIRHSYYRRLPFLPQRCHRTSLTPS